MNEPNIYDNQSDEQIIGIIVDLKSQKESISKEIKLAENVLVERKQKDIAAALNQKEEPFGSVSERIGDQKVTFNTKKEVEWDQAGLATNYKQMIIDGANPSEYIDAEFKIKENAYKNWPSDIKKFFEPHRTVKAGPVSVKIEPAKEGK